MTKHGQVTCARCGERYAGAATERQWPCRACGATLEWRASAPRVRIEAERLTAAALREAFPRFFGAVPQQWPS